MKRILLAILVSVTTARADYAVVVSAATQGDPEWRPVVEALVEKHQARVVTYSNTVSSVRAELAKHMPTYVAFVARPQEAGARFVAMVHQLMRRLDDDPYTDARWGIVTGYVAADALRIARWREPLVVRSGASSMGGPLREVPAGFASFETKKGKFCRWENGQVTATNAMPDAAELLAHSFNTQAPEMFITSGHATEQDWQIGYGFKGGEFRCERGQLYALNSAGQRFDITSSKPKVYLAAGNCLIGHIPRADPGWTEKFSPADGKLTFTLTTTRDGKWPDRPVCAWLPQRMPGAIIIAGQEHQPVVTDNFLLLPLAGEFKKGQKIVVGIAPGKTTAAHALEFLCANMPERARAKTSHRESGDVFPLWRCTNLRSTVIPVP